MKGLTYTSNALEGNSLTESETKVVIEDGLTIEGRPLMLAERLGRSLRTTQRYLKLLTEQKRIVFQGVAKKGGYVAV